MHANRTRRFQRRRYWRNLVLAGGGTLLAGALVIVIVVAIWSARLGVETLHPAQSAPERTPREVGIAIYEDVAFVNGDGITLRGWYVPPGNGAAILLAHGYGSNRDDLLDEAGLLAAHGYGVLLFDFGGHGTSDNALVTVGDRERRDLIAALDFLSTQPDVDADRIGALGLSMGGAALALVASEDARIRAVVIEAAFPTLEDVIADKAGLLGPLTTWPVRWAIEHEGVDVGAVRPVDALCAISPRPLLLIYGDHDEVAPPGSAEAMFAAACDPVERWLVPGAGHGSSFEIVPDAYGARLLRFFDAALSGD